MKQYVQSVLRIGYEGIVVEIECHLSNGLPSIVVVGLGNKAVGEAKERIRSAFASMGLTLPRKRITVNLAPADVPKDSSSLDLPIAAAILLASGQGPSYTKDQALIGEVGLNGSVRPVRGIIGKLLAGRQAGISTFFIPEANVRQASMVPDVKLLAIQTIQDLHTPPGTNLEPVTPAYAGTKPLQVKHSPTFSMIAGQIQAKRALEIAAAGGHNVLLSGPPGSGKSMLAKALPSILTPLSHAEMLEVTHLHSLASNNYDTLVTARPFRAPHSSASYAAMIGGGNEELPGEIALSHHGVLFLDEIAEFKRSILEALRQPLEDKYIVIARSRYRAQYPARFILIATANPCPCGYYGTDKACCCTPAQIQRYGQKLSGPILDRIDLHVTVESVDHSSILRAQPSELDDLEASKRVTTARQIQQKRYNSSEKTNADIHHQEVKAIACLSLKARALFDAGAKQLDISARSYVRMLKVARTIADLEGSDMIEVAHISEAFQYRPKLAKP